MTYDAYEVQVEVRGINDGETYARNEVAHFTIKELNEDQAMDMYRVAIRHYLDRFIRAEAVGQGDSR